MNLTFGADHMTWIPILSMPSKAFFLSPVWLSAWHSLIFSPSQLTKPSSRQLDSSHSHALVQSQTFHYVLLQTYSLTQQNYIHCYNEIGLLDTLQYSKLYMDIHITSHTANRQTFHCYVLISFSAHIYSHSKNCYLITPCLNDEHMYTQTCLNNTHLHLYKSSIINTCYRTVTYPFMDSSKFYINPMPSTLENIGYSTDIRLTSKPSLCHHFSLYLVTSIYL